MSFVCDQAPTERLYTLLKWWETSQENRTARTSNALADYKTEYMLGLMAILTSGLDSKVY